MCLNFQALREAEAVIPEEGAVLEAAGLREAGNRSSKRKIPL